MTAAGPDPYEIVRLLSADTFTQQDRDEWIRVAMRAVLVAYPFDRLEAEDVAAAVVDALLAYLAAQQARPMPGGGGQ